MNDVPIFKFAIREDLKDTGDLFLPKRGTPKATGWDVKAAFEDRKPLIVSVGEHFKIPLGFRAFVPEGFWYELKPRSSTFGKKMLHSLYGTIDEDFGGWLVFACQYLPNLETGAGGENLLVVKNQYLTIDFGEAIGQIVPVKRQEMIVESISNEEIDARYKERNDSRGTGGFGSTSK